MEITKIRGATGDEVYSRVNSALEAGGFRLDNPRVNPTNVAFKVSLEVSVAGHNINPHAESRYQTFGGKPPRGLYRKGMHLGWQDWVWVNNTINDVLDDMKVSANVQSLKGKFVIRRGMQHFGERDWAEMRYTNVGSMMAPVYLEDAWRPAENRVLPEDVKRGVHVKPYKRRRRA